MYMYVRSYDFMLYCYTVDVIMLQIKVPGAVVILTEP